jgi:hypothetical protein
MLLIIAAIFPGILQKKITWYRLCEKIQVQDEIEQYDWTVYKYFLGLLPDLL